MVCVTLNLVVKPDKRDEFLEVIRLVQEPIRVKQGCQGFNVYQNSFSRDDYLIVEKWESTEHLLAHLRSADYKMMIALMDVIGESADIRFNMVSESKGIDFLKDTLLVKEHK